MKLVPAMSLVLGKDTHPHQVFLYVLCEMDSVAGLYGSCCLVL